MAIVNPKMEVSFSLHLTLSEEEARALTAIAGYNDSDFLRVFYQHMGEAYLKPHEQGVVSLLQAIREQLSPALGHVDKSRKAISMALNPVKP